MDYYFPDKDHPITYYIEDVAHTCSFYLNSDWNDTPTMAIIENVPEMGQPIRRFRSPNVKHTISATVIMSYEEYNRGFLQFIQNINGGVDPFYFKSPVDSIYHKTTLSLSDGGCYSIKRNDNYSYAITLSFNYVTTLNNYEA